MALKQKIVCLFLSSILIHIFLYEVIIRLQGKHIRNLLGRYQIVLYIILCYVPIIKWRTQLLRLDKVSIVHVISQVIGRIFEIIPSISDN